MVLGAVLGKWWVPERPDRRVSGSLAAGDSFAQLSLIGDLEPPSTGNGFALFGLYEYDVVHGYEAAPFRKFTLFECSGTITPNFEPSYFDTRQELTVNAAVLVGCHMDKFDARTVSAARAQIFGLDHWLGAGTYIDELHRTVDEKSGAIKWTAETRSADFGTITLAQGMRIRAIDTGSRESSHTQDGTIFTVADNVAIELSYDAPTTISDSLEDVRIFLGLVTLFTGSTAWIQSRSILLQGHGDIAFELLESGHRALDAPNLIELKRRELLHSSEIDLQTVLPRWFQFNKDGGRAGINVLQAADYKDGQYVETNFLNAMTALESLYLALSKHHPAAFPRKRPAQSDDVAAKIGQARQALTPDLHVALRSTSKRDLQLKEKISTLLAWVGPTQFAVIVPTQNQAEWIAKAHAARNDLTHLGSFTAHVDTSGLNALQLGIRWLLKLALLKHLGIADELLVRAARSADGQAASYTFTNYLMPNLG